jgi:hypothetical protein
VPNPEEFDAAVVTLSKDPSLGPAIRDGLLQPYPAMPPLVDIDLPTTKVERTLTVGLLAKDAKERNEVVGVNMIRESVIRYEGGAPNTSNASALNCGVPSAGQTSNGRGVAGQYQVTIARGPELVWEFLMIRPSASSGNNASGIELRDEVPRQASAVARQCANSQRAVLPNLWTSSGTGHTRKGCSSPTVLTLLEEAERDYAVHRRTANGFGQWD